MNKIVFSTIEDENDISHETNSEITNIKKLFQKLREDFYNSDFESSEKDIDDIINNFKGKRHIAHNLSLEIEFFKMFFDILIKDDEKISTFKDKILKVLIPLSENKESCIKICSIKESIPILTSYVNSSEIGYVFAIKILSALFLNNNLDFSVGYNEFLDAFKNKFIVLINKDSLSEIDIICLSSLLAIFTSYIKNMSSEFSSQFSQFFSPFLQKCFDINELSVFTFDIVNHLCKNIDIIKFMDDGFYSILVSILQRMDIGQNITNKENSRILIGKTLNLIHNINIHDIVIRNESNIPIYELNNVAVNKFLPMFMSLEDSSDNIYLFESSLKFFSSILRKETVEDSFLKIFNDKTFIDKVLSISELQFKVRIICQVILWSILSYLDTDSVLGLINNTRIKYLLLSALETESVETPSILVKVNLFLSRHMKCFQNYDFINNVKENISLLCDCDDCNIRVLASTILRNFFEEEFFNKGYA